MIRELQDDYNFIHFGFICHSFKGSIQAAEPDKCEGWEYFPINEIPDHTLPAHKAAIKLLMDKSSTLLDLTK